MQDQPKKIKISPIQVIEASTTAPSVNKMLDHSLSIMGEQIERLRIKSRGTALDERESKVLLGYIKGLVEISKEEREREKADKGVAQLANMTTEELLQLAHQHLKPKA